MTSQPEEERGLQCRMERLIMGEKLEVAFTFTLQKGG